MYIYIQYVDFNTTLRAIWFYSNFFALSFRGRKGVREPYFCHKRDGLEAGDNVTNRKRDRCEKTAPPIRGRER